jgi:hypothetical protein
VLSSKESKARRERIVLGRYKVNAAGFGRGTQECIYSCTCVKHTRSGNMHALREEMTSRNNLKGRQNMSNNLSGQLLLPDEKSSFCIGCAL